MKIQNSKGIFPAHWVFPFLSKLCKRNRFFNLVRYCKASLALSSWLVTLLNYVHNALIRNEDNARVNLTISIRCNVSGEWSHTAFWWVHDERMSRAWGKAVATVVLVDTRGAQPRPAPSPRRLNQVLSGSHCF